MASPFHARRLDQFDLSVCSPLLDQCEHAKGRISYLRVPQYVPVFSQILLEELDNMPHGDCHPGGSVSIVSYISERNHPNGVPAGRNRVSLRQELPHHALHMLGRATAKPRQRNCKNGWIAHGCIESCGALLDFTHDHVRTL
jgi:hypothetical protein